MRAGSWIGSSLRADCYTGLRIAIAIRKEPLFETIFSDCIDPMHGRRLFLVAEPVAPTADGLLVAAEAIEALCGAFQGAAAETLASALSAAFESANDVVWAANRPGKGQALEGRIRIGMTAIAVAGDTILIAQAPPSQAILVQDGQLYAVPPLESWQSGALVEHEGEATAESNAEVTTAASPTPLGFARQVILRCHESTVSPSDLVMLCASALGWGLCRGLSESGAVAADLVPALTGDADSLRIGLDEIAAAFLEGRGPAARFHEMGSGRCWIWTASSHDVHEPAGALSVSIGQGGDRRFGAIGVSRSEGPTTSEVQPGVLLAKKADQETHDRPISPEEIPNLESGVFLCEDDNEEANAAGPLTGDMPLDEGVTMDDPRDPRVRGFLCRSQRDRIRYALVDASERVLGRRDQSKDRFAVGAREFLAPGSRSVRAYRSSIVGPISPELRAHLPRGPVIHVPVRFLSVLLACLIVLGGAGFLYDRHEERTAQAEQILAKADVELAKLAKAENGGVANVALIAAQAAVDDARDRGASDNLVASRQETIDAARDEMLGIVRLEQVTRVGTVPNLEKGDRTRLIRQGRDVYLVNGGFYQLNPGGRTLTELLAPGMRVGNAKVGKIRDGTVDGGVITVTDGKAIFRLNADRSWTRKKIGLVDGKRAWDSSSCGAFDGSFYLLNESGGQILKFEADRLSALPDNWAGSEAQGDLVEARDMVVDGRIYVLLANGDIQTYYRGALQTSLSLDVRPGLSGPKELYGAVDTAFLYVADRNGDQGRIVRFERGGAQARQYVLPPEGSDGAIDGAQRAFADIDDFVVDEVTGVIYILSGDQIWSATIPRTGTTA